MSACQMLLPKGSQAGRKDTARCCTEPETKPVLPRDFLFYFTFVYQKLRDIVCDFLLTMSPEELKRRLYWNNVETTGFLTGKLPSHRAALLRRAAVCLSVLRFTELKRGRTRTPEQWRAAPLPANVFSQLETALTILYTAARSLATRVGSVKLHSKAI